MVRGFSSWQRIFYPTIGFMSLLVPFIQFSSFADNLNRVVSVLFIAVGLFAVIHERKALHFSNEKELSRSKVLTLDDWFALISAISAIVVAVSAEKVWFYTLGIFLMSNVIFLSGFSLMRRYR